QRNTRQRQPHQNTHNHYLASPLHPSTQPPTHPSTRLPPKPQIQRHKAAIARVTVSKPVRLAVEAGLFPSGTTYFDYGCGHGADMEYLARLGYAAWDPYYQPGGDRTPADVVNLGYVIFRP
ncbi:MAG: DNA phosphorothioation-associated methyltransferase, partial [Elainellaceae cyanobacterium]